MATSRKSTKRVRCPVCSKGVALTTGNRTLRRHGGHGSRCPASYHTVEHAGKLTLTLNEVAKAVRSGIEQPTIVEVASWLRELYRQCQDDDATFDRVTYEAYRGWPDSNLDELDVAWLRCIRNTVPYLLPLPRITTQELQLITARAGGKPERREAAIRTLKATADKQVAREKAADEACERAIRPVVNLNGTSRRELGEQQSAVLSALIAVQEAQAQAAPHGRDYQTEPAGSYEAARDEHRRRCQIVSELVELYQADALAIHRGA